MFSLFYWNGINFSRGAKEILEILFVKRGTWTKRKWKEKGQ
jgi:hypothetical protein